MIAVVVTLGAIAALYFAFQAGRSYADISWLRFIVTTEVRDASTQLNLDSTTEVHKETPNDQHP